MPWAWGTGLETPSGAYHLVWARDSYEIATALIADGDRAAALRALEYFFHHQQEANGSFPANSALAGKPVFTALELDEVADPILLDYQLGRSDAADWSHVRRAANFLVSYRADGHRAPWSPEERWENQSGYSPATIAAEIAGLVCAAHIASANGRGALARRYLSVADRWQRKVESWTVTTNGPYSPRPYFLRLSKDGNPDAATSYAIGDSGPTVDQRRVVDPSFLELVRLGVEPAANPAVRNTLAVVNAQLGVQTRRASCGTATATMATARPAPAVRGGPNPAGTFVTRGRLRVLLAGERGEYDLLAGQQEARGGNWPRWQARPPRAISCPSRPGTTIRRPASPASAPGPPPHRPPRSAGPRPSSSGWPGQSRRAARWSSQPPSPAGTRESAGSRVPVGDNAVAAAGRLRQPRGCRSRPAARRRCLAGAQRLDELLLGHCRPARNTDLLGPAPQVRDLPVIVGTCRATVLGGLLAGNPGGAVRDPGSAMSGPGGAVGDPRRYLPGHARAPEPLVKVPVLDPRSWILLRHNVTFHFTTALRAVSERRPRRARSGYRACLLVATAARQRSTVPGRVAPKLQTGRRGAVRGPACRQSPGRAPRVVTSSGGGRRPRGPSSRAAGV